MPIAKLPPLLVNQIAAGEVIERPASVVKELVENSLDAGARRVDVTVEEGGSQLIRISDDGQGIPEAELPLAVAPHATSKIQQAAHLASIATLGFRGEALASIASVSRLRITSRARIDGRLVEHAAALEAAGDTIGSVTPAATAAGTIIEVRDLFFNTPARRKFMRSVSTEIAHIHETVHRAALANAHVAFSVTHNGRKTIDLPATDEPRKRCVEILGKDIAKGLLEFEHRDEHVDSGVCVWGLAGQPALCRSSGKFIHLCLNGRPIKDRNLTHAVREAYRGLVPQDKHPLAVVFVHMPASAVDVNVHPTKAEVRFRQPNRIHSLVLTAIRQRLLGADLTPTATLGASRPAGFGFNRASQVSAEPPGEPLLHEAPTPKLSTDQFVDFFKRMDPTQKGFVYQQVKQAYDGSEAENAPAEAHGAPSPQTEDVYTLRAQSILQIHDAYVVTQDEQGLVIVDQHALHERVMFEELRQRVLGQGRNLESQRLLMPAVFDASESQQSILAGLGPLLTRIGVEIEPIGPNSVAIQAFPTFLFDRGVEPAPFMEDLLAKAEAGELPPGSATVEEAAVHKVLDMMSCKAAVKAGDKLTEPEIAALLAKRDQVERSSNCPHGRPTTVRLTLRELAKQFKRT